MNQNNAPIFRCQYGCGTIITVKYPAKKEETHTNLTTRSSPTQWILDMTNLGEQSPFSPFLQHLSWDAQTERESQVDDGEERKIDRRKNQRKHSLNASRMIPENERSTYI